MCVLRIPQQPLHTVSFNRQSTRRHFSSWSRWFWNTARTPMSPTSSLKQVRYSSGVYSPKGEPKWRRKLAWKCPSISVCRLAWKCPSISVCWLAWNCPSISVCRLAWKCHPVFLSAGFFFFGSYSNIYTKETVLNCFKFKIFRGTALLVHSLLVKSGKQLACDIFDNFVAHSSFVYNPTDAGGLAQTGIRFPVKEMGVMAIVVSSIFSFVLVGVFCFLKSESCLKIDFSQG